MSREEFDLVSDKHAKKARPGYLNSKLNSIIIRG
jgi:hypothetical protein